MKITHKDNPLLKAICLDDPSTLIKLIKSQQLAPEAYARRLSLNNLNPLQTAVLAGSSRAILVFINYINNAALWTQAPQDEKNRDEKQDERKHEEKQEPTLSALSPLQLARLTGRQDIIKLLYCCDLITRHSIGPSDPSPKNTDIDKVLLFALRRDLPELFSRALNFIKKLLPEEPNIQGAMLPILKRTQERKQEQKSRLLAISPMENQPKLLPDELLAKLAQAYLYIKDKYPQEQKWQAVHEQLSNTLKKYKKQDPLSIASLVGRDDSYLNYNAILSNFTDQEFLTMLLQHNNPSTHTSTKQQAQLIEQCLFHRDAWSTPQQWPLLLTELIQKDRLPQSLHHHAYDLVFQSRVKDTRATYEKLGTIKPKLFGKIAAESKMTTEQMVAQSFLSSMQARGEDEVPVALLTAQGPLKQRLQALEVNSLSPSFRMTAETFGFMAITKEGKQVNSFISSAPAPVLHLLYEYFTPEAREGFAALSSHNFWHAFLHFDSSLAYKQKLNELITILEPTTQAIQQLEKKIITWHGWKATPSFLRIIAAGFSVIILVQSLELNHTENKPTEEQKKEIVEDDTISIGICSGIVLFLLVAICKLRSKLKSMEVLKQQLSTGNHLGLGDENPCTTIRTALSGGVETKAIALCTAMGIQYQEQELTITQIVTDAKHQLASLAASDQKVEESKENQTKPPERRSHSQSRASVFAPLPDHKINIRESKGKQKEESLDNNDSTLLMPLLAGSRDSAGGR